MKTIRDYYDDGDLLLTSDVADLLGVVTQRVLQLCDPRKTRRLHHVTTPKGRRIFARADVERFKKERAK